MKVIKILSLFLYIFTSSVMVHAFSMGNIDMTKNNSHINHQQTEKSTCHNNTTETNSDECLDSCFNPYMEYSINHKLVLDNQIVCDILANIIPKKISFDQKYNHFIRYTTSSSPPGEFTSSYVGITLLLI